MSSPILIPSLWDNAHTKSLDEPGLLLYRSNLLGSDLRITNFGGGNTSAKVEMTDPLTKKPVQVLWVKGSGGDIASMPPVRVSTCPRCSSSLYGGSATGCSGFHGRDGVRDAHVVMLSPSCDSVAWIDHRGNAALLTVQIASLRGMTSSMAKRVSAVTVRARSFICRDPQSTGTDDVLCTHARKP